MYFKLEKMIQLCIILMFTVIICANDKYYNKNRNDKVINKHLPSKIFEYSKIETSKEIAQNMANKYAKSQGLYVTQIKEYKEKKYHDRQKVKFMAEYASNKGPLQSWGYKITKDKEQNFDITIKRYG